MPGWGAGRKLDPQCMCAVGGVSSSPRPRLQAAGSLPGYTPGFWGQSSQFPVHRRAWPSAGRGAVPPLSCLGFLRGSHSCWGCCISYTGSSGSPASLAEPVGLSPPPPFKLGRCFSCCCAGVWASLCHLVHVVAAGPLPTRRGCAWAPAPCALSAEPVPGSSAPSLAGLLLVLPGAQFSVPSRDCPGHCPAFPARPVTSMCLSVTTLFCADDYICLLLCPQGSVLYI